MRRTHRLVLLLSVFFTILTSAAIEVNPIPRIPSSTFRKEGLFEGGKDTRANLETIRLASHPLSGFERWVVDFSDVRKGNVGGVAPKFQLQYYPSERITGDDGLEVTRKPAKFIFVFRSIQTNRLTRDKVRSLVKKSRHVRNIIIYPPIEGGDMALEFILRGDVLFQPLQPKEKEGRLVLDLKKIG